MTMNDPFLLLGIEGSGMTQATERFLRQFYDRPSLIDLNASAWPAQYRCWPLQLCAMLKAVRRAASKKTLLYRTRQSRLSTRLEV